MSCTHITTYMWRSEDPWDLVLSCHHVSPNHWVWQSLLSLLSCKHIPLLCRALSTLTFLLHLSGREGDNLHWLWTPKWPTIQKGSVRSQEGCKHWVCLSLSQMFARCCLMFTCLRVFCHCFPELKCLRFLGTAFRTEKHLFLRLSSAWSSWCMWSCVFMQEDEESLGTGADQH